MLNDQEEDHVSAGS